MPAFDRTGANAPSVTRATTLLKALAHDARLEILCQLIEGEHTVGEICEVLQLPQAVVSQQLMRLRAEGLVGGRREGRHIHYHLERPEVRAIIVELQRTFCTPPPSVA